MHKKKKKDSTRIKQICHMHLIRFVFLSKTSKIKTRKRTDGKYQMISPSWELSKLKETTSVLWINLKSSGVSVRYSDILDNFLRSWGSLPKSASFRVCHAPLSETDGLNTLVYVTTDAWDPPSLFVRTPSVIKMFANVYFWNFETDVLLRSVFDFTSSVKTSKSYLAMQKVASQGIKGLLQMSSIPGDIDGSLALFARAAHEKKMNEIILKLGDKLKHMLDSEDLSFLTDDLFWEKKGTDLLYRWWEDPMLKQTPSFSPFFANNKPFGVSSVVASMFRPGLVSRVADSAFGFLKLFSKRRKPQSSTSYLLQLTLIPEYFKMPKELIPVAVNQQRSWSLADKSDGNISTTLMQSLISGCGPFLVKLFQDIGQTPNSPLSSMAKGVFSQIPDVTEAEKTQMMNCVRQDSGIKAELDKAASVNWIGAASIGQVMQLKGPDQNQFLKVLKPSAMFLFLCELTFIFTVVWRKVADHAYKLFSRKEAKTYIIQVRQTLIGVVQGYCKEFDVQDECRSIQKGKLIYKDPIKVIDCLAVSPKCSALLMSAAQGVSLDVWLNSNPSPKQANYVLKQLQYLLGYFTIGSVLTGDGFHTDLHPGNIYVNFKNDHEVELTMIDFGGFGTVPEAQRLSMLAVTLFGESLHLPGNSKISLEKRFESILKFAAGINLMCLRSSTDEEVFEMAVNILNTQMFLVTPDISTLFAAGMNKIPDLGKCLNVDVIMYARGIQYLTQIMYKIADIAGEEQQTIKQSLKDAIKKGWSLKLSKSLLKTVWNIPKKWPYPQIKKSSMTQLKTQKSLMYIKSY
jgi:hypothetical protein